MKQVTRALQNSEDWLVDRVVAYARDRDYTRYTSTLREAWRASVVGLLQAILSASAQYDTPPELSPDDNYTDDPISGFGVLEARRHRERGVTLSMFLGLMKYYRQAFQDRLADAGLPADEAEQGRLFLDRCFDRIEIGFCQEWGDLSTGDQLQQLQGTARGLMNEKNRYLTIFESLSTPVFLFDAEGRVLNVNHAGALLFGGKTTPGTGYYGGPWLGDRLPALAAQLKQLSQDGDSTGELDLQLETTDGPREFHVKLQQMLDISGRFQGAVALFNDLTERKRLEADLRAMSLRDELTGLYNRRAFVTLGDQQLRLARRTGAWHALLFIDLDRMKAINDSFGHHVGDQALRDLAGLLRTSFRESDLLARFGGDEFAVLAQATAQSVETVTRRLQQGIGQLNASAARPYRLEASIGVAHIEPWSSEGIGKHIKQADSAMYRRKRETRETAALRAR